MIPRIHERTHTPHDPLGEALGRPVPFEGGLAEHTVVAYWPGLDSHTLNDEQASWTTAQWAQHLEDPLLEHPFAASPKDDRRAIFHLNVRLHPDDRHLTGAEWAEAAHRLARAAGIEIPGDHNGCHWIAVQGRPGRLDLIANLIRLDGAWQPQPADLTQRISGEARRIEHDLRLTRVRDGSRQPNSARAVPTQAAQSAAILAKLADEGSGPLAAARKLIEHTAHRLDALPGSNGAEAGHHLEWAARRLFALQQDLDRTATALLQPAGRTKTIPFVPSPPPVPGSHRAR
ncbi:relaxase/mobilization nuclease [Streptomyces niveus]|uniref:Relaxase/mobilization nuclease n=1 Tax=Streptomyces niveus TaxID=193462 RepID=A0ABZ1ZYK4_STRNV|nr:relaxase/mobilization nuclease [Streptomyces niveus]